MASKSNEFLKYKQLKVKIKMTKADIIFLQKCKHNHWTPSFINITSNSDSTVKDRVLQFAREKWLKLELHYKYGLLNSLDLQAYKLHRLLANSIDPTTWTELDNNLNETLIFLFKEKMSTIKSKLNKLRRNQNLKPIVKHIDNIVVNQSSESFSSDELNLLNKGFNFALPPERFPLSNTVTDIETGIFYMPFNEKQKIREVVKPILMDANNIDTPQLNTHTSISYQNTLKSLCQKDVYYCKADKGNNIVILNKSDYDQRMLDAINEGPYTEVNNPIKFMIADIKKAIQNHQELFYKGWRFRMYASNPIVPKIYGLPKIHKPGNKLRFIVSNINAPSHNVAKFLVNEFSKLKQYDDFSIKNSFDLIEKLKTVKLNSDEILVSFDITSYFPSVPVNEALKCLEIWLMKQPNMPPLKQIAFHELAAQCMKQNFFVFREKYYKQDTGTAMGNPLSPFMCNLFILKLENLLRKDALFPRFWKRYVDDIFAIVDKNKLPEIFELLNSICEQIKFTCEEEVNGSLPFLDLKIIRSEDGRLNFDIYRKPTHTDRFITADSFHHQSHKYAAFNSMIHRLVNVPLSKELFDKEWNYILKTADLNGYTQTSMERLLKRHRRKLLTRDSTSFVSDNNNKKFRIAVEFFPTCTDKLEKACSQQNIQVVSTSIRQKLKTNLHSTKDKTNTFEKSGVYQMCCPYGGCTAMYIGETRRALNVRADEHIKHIAKQNIDSSAIAEHAIHSGHRNIQKDDFRLLASTGDNRRLKVIEAIHIHKHSGQLINRDEGYVPNSSLIDLL